MYMHEKNDIYRSVLIVSASEPFVSVIKNLLSGHVSTEAAASIALARRYVIERYYDLIAINAPLPDENGCDFAIDAASASGASILLVTPQETFEEVLEQVTGLGILAVPKPVPRGRIRKAIRFLAAVQEKRYSLERKVQAAEEKLEELRMMDRAKFMLMERRHMTEDEAHRYIGKKAMDGGVSRGKAARRILEDME